MDFKKTTLLLPLLLIFCTSLGCSRKMVFLLRDSATKQPLVSQKVRLGIASYCLFPFKGKSVSSESITDSEGRVVFVITPPRRGIIWDISIQNNGEWEWEQYSLAPWEPDWQTCNMIFYDQKANCVRETDKTIEIKYLSQEPSY